MLAFISDKRDGIRQEIYRMNADGTDLTRLTTNGASLVGAGAVWKGPPMGMLPKGVTSFGRGPCGQVGVCLARFSGDVDDSGALTFKISDMDNMGGNESRHLLDIRSGGTCSLDSFSLVGPGGTLYSLPIALERRDNTTGRLHRGFPAGEYTARLTTSNCTWEYRFMLGTPHLGS